MKVEEVNNKKQTSIGWEVIIFGKENDEKWCKIALSSSGILIILAGKNFVFNVQKPENSSEQFCIDMEVTERRSPNTEELEFIRERLYTIESIK